MSSPLADLDELILKCRNERAKSIIHEAVASYRAGAFRASIVATWIAVCFDFIDKLHELSLAGDNEAETHTKTLERIRANEDLGEALKFEKELLQLAKDKFEWVSPLEYMDLERLREDRNRCAHPSLIAEGQTYNPPAELARLHIHSAVTSVLEHPPAQGKYALERLTKEVASEYFPIKPDEAKAYLLAGPLKRARESLVRNFVIILLKEYLLESKNAKDHRYRTRIISALKATFAMHPRHFDGALREKLSDIARRIEEKKLMSLANLLRSHPDTWNYLENDVTQKLINYVKDLPSDKLDDLDVLLLIKPLKESAEIRIKKTTINEVSETTFFILPEELGDHLISMYLRSHSFDSANRVAKEIIKYADDFSGDQVRRVITKAKENSQVTGSFELSALLNAFRKHKAVSPREFETLLAAHDLGEFVEDIDDEREE